MKAGKKADFQMNFKNEKNNLKKKKLVLRCFRTRPRWNLQTYEHKCQLFMKPTETI